MKLVVIKVLAAGIWAQFLCVPFSIYAQSEPELIYVGDPMCSWCYGFAPEITKLKQKYEDSVRFRLIIGGLHPGNTDPMNEKYRSFLREHWEGIHEKTGQPFRYDILSDTTFIYDTEPADRAVVTIKHLRPDSAFAFFKQVQRTFYVKNKNMNEVNTYLPLAEAAGIDPGKFRTYFESDSMKKATWDDFNQAMDWEANLFPTVFLKVDGELEEVTVGYESFEKMDKRVNNLLHGRESLWNALFK